MWKATREYTINYEKFHFHDNIYESLDNFDPNSFDALKFFGVQLLIDQNYYDVVHKHMKEIEDEIAESMINLAAVEAGTLTEALDIKK